MTFTTFCRLLSQAVIHSRQPVALNWARNSFGLVLTVFLRKICILGIAEYFLIVLFQISEIKKDEIRFKKYIFLLDMFLIVGGGRVPVTGMLAGMNLSKPGINLSKPGMNLSKPGKKHHNHVIIWGITLCLALYVMCVASVQAALDPQWGAKAFWIWECVWGVDYKISWPM